MIYKAKLKLRDILLCCLIVFSSSAFAIAGRVYVGGTIATSSTQISNNHPSINYYDGNLTDDYPVHGSRSNQALFGINAGYEFTGNSIIPAVALGLGIYSSPRHTYHGRVVETALGDPSFALYANKFHIDTARMMVETQFNWAYRSILPYINLGVGLVWNHVQGYQETSLDNIGYVPLPAFRSKTLTHFAYQIGIGIGYDFQFLNDPFPCQRERISLGYRFVDLGRVSFGTRGSDYPYRLNLGRLSAQEFYLIYAHYF